MEKQETIEEVVRRLKPSLPIYFLRPKSLEESSSCFLNNFVSSKYKTRILYSVKSNPEEDVLLHLYNQGIMEFDVASLSEIKLIDELFDRVSVSYFMHPIKSREAIHEAYFEYGIRDFSLDSFDELNKILEVTKNAKDLNLHVRLAVSNSHAHIDLSGKFGILPCDSIDLLLKCREVANRLGICFHVGSQCMEPTEYRNVLTIIKEIIEEIKLDIDVIDIGGGFPSVYPAMNPPSLSNYFDEIFDAINQLPLKETCEIWCEPGRALVAESTSLVVRVEARKNNILYINDGTYGGLFDAGYPEFIYPVKAIRLNGEFSNNSIGFSFFGPTCDSLDAMKGPFYLPDDIKEGDYIEIGQLGAYSRSMRTNFNGFGKSELVETNDKPLISMYQ